jgi:hypothetical protein
MIHTWYMRMTGTSAVAFVCPTLMRLENAQNQDRYHMIMQAYQSNAASGAIRALSIPDRPVEPNVAPLGPAEASEAGVPLGLSDRGLLGLSNAGSQGCWV